MKCACDYCVYNRDSLCILDSPEINSLGMCDSCIVISLDQALLEREKELQLRELESR